ncbi:MAG TPA: cytochrome P450, partial [Ilumatobacteraceae bacterium]
MTAFELDLSDAATFALGHPWEKYRWLREHAPVWRHPDTERAKGGWVLSRYDDIKSVSRRPNPFSSERGGVMLEDSDEMSLAVTRLMMLNMDPPQHDRFKLLVSRGFTPKNAKELSARIDQLATEIVDDVFARGDGRCDFVTDIAGRLPSGLIAEMMGIPRTDGERLYELTEIMHSGNEELHPPAVKMNAIIEMHTYANGVAAAKRANPADDIASTLVAAEVDGERLTDDEFAWFFLLLVNAGGDTTRNLVAAGMQLLLDRPDEYARVRADPAALIPTTVEEMLRYTTPVMYFRRTLTDDTVLHDTPMAAGDKVIMLYGSANRDEAVFSDADRFDVGRNPNPHLAFGGGGPHLCLGMHVARIEIASLLNEVVQRMPDLRLDGEVERMRSNFIAGIHAMPVAFSAS